MSLCPAKDGSAYGIAQPSFTPLFFPIKNSHPGLFCYSVAAQWMMSWVLRWIIPLAQKPWVTARKVGFSVNSVTENKASFFGAMQCAIMNESKAECKGIEIHTICWKAKSLKITSSPSLPYSLLTFDKRQPNTLFPVQSPHFQYLLECL